MGNIDGLEQLEARKCKFMITLNHVESGKIKTRFLKVCQTLLDFMGYDSFFLQICELRRKI